MEPFPSSPEDPTSNGKHHKTRSRDLSFSELDPVLREQLKPNAHPYAIRTTSTALLSRSNSQSQRETRHSYVPSSPQRERGHRKGSSSFGGITAATPGSPRPLPVPPNTTSPTRQPRRAESAAPELAYQFPSNESSWIRHNSTSSASSSSMDLADLPPNPKIWTPSQLSAYLTTALRVRSGVKGDGEQEQEDLKLPVRVAQDIAAFVREKKINGRVFLRWEEGDLEGYGINKLWRTALLTSSRNLRQNVLRGRIWGFEDESLPTSPSGLRSPNPDTGSPNVPSLTPIPSVMYTPSAIRPNSSANLGAFEMMVNDTIESPTSTRPTLGHGGGVDGLPLSSGLGMGAPFVASVTTGSVQSGETVTEQESVPVFPSNANRYIIPKDGVAVKVAGDNIHDMERDEGQASIYTFNTAGGDSPTRSPRGQAALNKEDEDEDSTPNKRSTRVSPPSTTPSNTNTMNKRPLPNPHSYISGTNARNAGSVRTRGVPMLSAEMVEMMKKEGLGLEGVDLNELGGLDLDQLGELGIDLGFGDEGVGLGAGSGSAKGIRGGTKSAGTSLRLRPKRKSASGQGAPSTMPIGSQSLRIRTRTAPTSTTKIRDNDDDYGNGAMAVPMLPSNHPNFPNGLPVYSSASEGEPALELGLGGSIRKRKELQEQEGTMGRAGGRKSLSRVMARELVSKSKKMMMEQDNNPLPPLPHSPSSSSRIKVKGMVQTFERSTSFDEGQVGDDTQDQGDAKREDKEGRRSRILEDMKALREMARVRRERSGSTSSLSSTHSDSTHSESDSGSSVGPGARDNDNDDVFLSSPVEDKVGEGLGTMRPLPVPPVAVDLGYDTATAKMVKSLPSPPPSSQQQTQIISPTQLLPPTPPLSVGAEEPTIEELLAEQDAAAAAAGLAASGVHGQGHAYAYAYGAGPNEGTDTMKYVGSSVSTSAVGGDGGDIGRGSAGGKGKKNRVGSRVKASDVANGTGSLKGSSTARKGVGVYAWEAEVEDGEERDNSYELAAGESPSGKPKTNKGRVTVKRVPTQALQDAPSPGKVRPLPVPPETTDDNEESVASLAKSIKQTKTLLAAFEERLGEVERKVEVMEEREEAKQREQEGENKKGKNKSFMQRLVYRFFGISLGSKSTAVPSEEKDSNASSASDKPPSSSPSSSTPESRIQRALASRIPQRYHARLAAVLDPRTLMAIAPYVLFMSIGMCVVVWRLMMRRGGIAVTARR